MPVIWSPAALRDILQIYTYITQFNPVAAENVSRALLAAGDSLTLFPDRGRPVPGTMLRELTVVYPYIIRYRVAGDHVRMHSSAFATAHAVHKPESQRRRERKEKEADKGIRVRLAALFGLQAGLGVLLAAAAVWGFWEALLEGPFVKPLAVHLLKAFAVLLG